MWTLWTLACAPIDPEPAPEAPGVVIDDTGPAPIDTGAPSTPADPTGDTGRPGLEIPSDTGVWASPVGRVFIFDPKSFTVVEPSIFGGKSPFATSNLAIEVLAIGDGTIDLRLAGKANYEAGQELCAPTLDLTAAYDGTTVSAGPLDMWVTAAMAYYPSTDVSFSFRLLPDALDAAGLSLSVRADAIIGAGDDVCSYGPFCAPCAADPDAACIRWVTEDGDAAWDPTHPPLVVRSLEAVQADPECTIYWE